MEHIEKPEDLGIKVGTADESFWSDMKKMTEDQNKTADRTLELNKIILAYCEKRIAEEQKV
tara:strand:+ start:406 stop:588 length:183 start_codon:yes stop_codon:yes gene_type:complete